MPTVVLGYVPKPEGHAALAEAITEAARRDAGLVLVNAQRARHLEADPQASEADEELAAAVAQIEAAGVAVDVRHPDSGLDAAEDLLSVAREVGAELIVIGLRRRTPVGKLILGSNAQHILLDAECPVLAVKAP